MSRYLLKPIIVPLYPENLNFHGPYPFQYPGETAYNGLSDIMIDAFYFYFMVWFYIIILSIHHRMVE